MAGIKDVITDLLTLLETVTDLQYVRVFNNQFAQMESGTVESFPMPCSFVEIISPNNYDQLAIGYTISDLNIRIHLGIVEYDAGGGNMEQNLTIFALRDKVIKKLTYHQLSGCSGLMKIAESQDYEHTNVYHYTIDFKCSFVDKVGGTDSDLIIKDPPTDLEINPITIVTTL